MLIVLLYFSFSTYKYYNLKNVYGDHQLHVPLAGVYCMWQNEVVKTDAPVFVWQKIILISSCRTVVSPLQGLF